MRKIFSYLFTSLFFFITFCTGLVNVKADLEHEFSIKAYDWNAFDNDWEGSGTGDELTENSDVEPGRVIQVDVYYVPGDQKDISMQIGLKYDSTLVEPMYDEDELYVEYDMKTTYDNGIWPSLGTSKTQRSQTSWQILYNHYEEGNMITFIVKDSKGDKPLEKEGVIATVYFKIKETAQAGSVINFSFDNEYTMLSKKSPKVTNGLNLNVFGEMSENTTLSSLEVKRDDTNFDLEPKFVPNNNENKEFNVIVPNHITDITINAEASDQYSQVASGTGSRFLNVGNNDINIIVQAQDGTNEIYVLHIYRLNDDATLSSLSLTNDIDIGKFQKDNIMYTALVPYKTKSTLISATLSDKNAKIMSDLGIWNLTNYGEDINTKDIIVNAENCDLKYADVKENACTSKTYKINITRISPSNNANLTSILVNEREIDNFSQGLYTYDLPDVSYETDSIQVSATVEDKEAKILSQLGKINLIVGDNKIDIVVQAEDGSEKTYTLNVRRLSNNSKLQTLTVTSDPMGELSPSFSSDFYDYYTYIAPSTVKTVTVEGVVQDTDNANIISGNGIYNIDDTNTVSIYVQAEDGTQSIYKIKLVRSKSSNNNLKSLSIDGYSLNEEFSPDVTLYTANVSGDVTKVNILAEVEDKGKAVIVSGIGEKKLEVGNNIVQIRVQAENGNIKDYTITINRKRKTVAALTDLKVDQKSIEGFYEDVFEYTLPKVSFEKTSINIEAQLKDPDSTVTGTGEIPLNTGNNTIYVVVTAQDELTQTTYTINIEREKDSNAYLRDLQIDGLTIENFSKDNLNYEITVPNEKTSLDLNAIPDSDSAEVTISNNSNFVTTKVNIVNITVTAESGNVLIYNVNVKREKSDNNYLDNITLSSGVLTPVFDKYTNDYSVNVDRSITAIVITPILSDLSSKYEISGPDSLEIGANTYIIKVTSESEKENTYTIVVNRNPSSNNYLSSLLIDGRSINDFDKNKTLYQLNVDSEKENVIINAKAEDSYAKVSGIGTFDLITGINTFNIKVIAEDGNERTYSIVINKDRSNNSKLSELSITQTILSPTFKEDILNYTANVSYAVTNIDIVAVTSDKKATVTGDGNKELVTGENTFNIVVTSENNTTTTYTIVVTRAKNNNANLSNIVLSGGFFLDKEFSPNVIDYNVSVPNSVDSINITAYKEDPNAISVTGDGLINLNTGKNKINIVVIAEDGVTRKTYTINIDRAKSNDATLKELSIEGGILVPNFSPTTLNYEIIVPHEISEFVAVAVANSDAASVNIDEDKTLNVGSNIKNITVIAEDGTLNVYKITVLRQPSTNNYLSSLSVTDINSKEYVSEFAQIIMNYNITVENNISEITINATLDDNTSKVVGLGVKQLDIGNNSFDIVVTSASNIQRTYKVNVFRKANSNNYLTELGVSEGKLTPEFKKDIVSYTVNVNSDVTSINIYATAEVETSIVEGTGQFDIKTGVNTFNIIVTAEDKSKKTYIIVVDKMASSNNNLSSLTITPGELTPEFNKNQLEYTVNLDNITQTLTIDALAEHQSAKVTGTGVKSVNVGEQTYDIVVTAEDNTAKTYKIKVTRASSSVKDLKSLTVDGKLVEGFNKDITTYSMHVENNVEKIYIDAELLDETASILGTGEISLHTGNNTIYVTVTAEDGSIKVYEINIFREKSSNNYLSSLTINDGIYSPEFNKETLIYNITVPYEVTSLDIDAIKEDSSATVEIDSNSDFIVGENKVYINVIAENESVRTYIINVTRQQQANNFLTDITITGNDGKNYNLSPSFNKTVYSYDVELNSSVSEVNITVEKQSLSLLVNGDGNVVITSFPQVQRIIVSTPSGLQRVYTIRFTKGLSSNDKLLSLSVDKGVLQPSFNPDELAYNVDLESGTNEITITTTKGDENQTVIGDGLKNLNPGRNTIKIIVTAENGSIRTYTIFINVAESKENVLTSITVDKGTLMPEFNKDIKLYTVDLDQNEEKITINATGSNKITGIGEYSLDIGSNVFEIITKDNTGKENIYRVIVNRGNIDNSSYLKYLQIDGYKMNEKFNKDIFDYTLNVYDNITSLNVVAVPENKNANVIITGNLNMTVGDNNITIVVTDENQDSKTYNIKVFIGNNKITSNVHTIDDKYITTIEENNTVNEIKQQMTNPVEQLKIYNGDNVELQDSDIVTTGCIIKLIINETEYDSKTLVIKGDINSDGEVTVSDIVKLRLHILETNSLNDVESIAADTNSDMDINVADLIQIRGHILRTYNLYGRE